MSDHHSPNKLGGGSGDNSSGLNMGLGLGKHPYSYQSPQNVGNYPPHYDANYQVQYTSMPRPRHLFPPQQQEHQYQYQAQGQTSPSSAMLETGSFSNLLAHGYPNYGSYPSTPRPQMMPLQHAYQCPNPIGSEGSDMHGSASGSQGSKRSRDGDSEAHSPQKKSKRKVGNNKTWLSCHDDVLIPFLAEQVRMGLKPDKSFKNSTFTQAVALVNEKCGSTFTTIQAKNHEKVLRTCYQLMEQALHLSGAGWDEAAQTVTLDSETYRKWAADHNNAKVLYYVNKPLKHFEDLKLIVGSDAATGSFQRSSYSNLPPPPSQAPSQVDVDDDDDDEAIEVTQVESQRRQRASSSLKGDKKNKGRRTSNAYLTDAGVLPLAAAVEKVAIAINELPFLAQLGNMVRQFEGIYPTSVLDDAMDFFMENKKEAKHFLYRSQEARSNWLKDFVERRGGQG